MLSIHNIDTVQQWLTEYSPAVRCLGSRGQIKLREVGRVASLGGCCSGSCLLVWAAGSLHSNLTSTGGGQWVSEDRQHLLFLHRPSTSPAATKRGKGSTKHQLTKESGVLLDPSEASVSQPLILTVLRRTWLCGLARLLSCCCCCCCSYQEAVPRKLPPVIRQETMIY